MQAFKPSSAVARYFDLAILRGVGQIMFQGHAGTGVCFLAGIALASPIMLLGAVLGALIGPMTARVAGFDKDQIEQGLFGFNSTLVGLATLFFLKPAGLTFTLLVLGCIASTFITWLAMRFLPFPAYTGPFVVSTWILLVIAHAIAGNSLDVSPASEAVAPGGFIEQVLRGEAEVMLGANVVTGILFLVGIALSDVWHAGMALLGSIVGTAMADYHGDPTQAISIGIYGYNAALAAMAMFLKRKSLTLPILAALIATGMTEFFPKSLGVPALTGPFVAASWLMLAVIWLEDRLFGEARWFSRP
ncbi:urea transporter [Paludisphaera rhizosphaerae]|uniref:urea transporter n=1 Tax=Paludisphaera rhizosphaerae TaxID=2711216 RepID=UPI0013ED00E8|nr:urea transporter [Paludisphaera rhizosphaerae]